MIRNDSRGACVRTITRTVLFLPFLAVPFGIWTFETWVQMQIYSNDYELTTMRSQRDQIHDQIEQLEDRAAFLSTLRKLEASVTDEGLVEPLPGQIRVIRLSESDLNPKMDVEVAPQRFAEADIMGVNRP